MRTEARSTALCGTTTYHDAADAAARPAHGHRRRIDVHRPSSPNKARESATDCIRENRRFGYMRARKRAGGVAAGARSRSIRRRCRRRLVVSIIVIGGGDDNRRRLLGCRPAHRASRSPCLCTSGRARIRLLTQLPMSGAADYHLAVAAAAIAANELRFCARQPPPRKAADRVECAQTIDRAFHDCCRRLKEFTFNFKQRLFACRRHCSRRNHRLVRTRARAS